MDKELTPKIALQTLFEASRLAKMTAQEHFLSQQCKQVLEDLILSLEQAKKSTETVVDKKN